MRIFVDNIYTYVCRVSIEALICGSVKLLISLDQLSRSLRDFILIFDWFWVSDTVCVFAWLHFGDISISECWMFVFPLEGLENCQGASYRDC